MGSYYYYLVPLSHQKKPRATPKTKKAPNPLEALCFLVENIGVEPMTSCLPGKRSSQLS